MSAQKLSVRKLSARHFWLVALAALLGTAHASAARAADAVNVATPSVVIFASPYWIAERQGYFKDEDITPTLDIEPNGKRITERLLSGATQFSLVGPDAVLIDATEGGPLRILAGIVRKPPLFLIAKSSIKTFADLRGANIGALSLTEGSSKLLIKMAKARGSRRPI
jgi:ABC-type nitrate/sulfonate/bicarbonate transport system substrate-binding protein